MRHFAFYRRITQSERLAGAYDAAAANWQKGIAGLGYPAAYAALAEQAVALEPSRHGETLLDVGTGSGAMGLAMMQALRQHAEIDLMDMSEEMLRAAKAALPQVRNCFTGLIGGTRLPSSAYDRVSCAHAIEHGPDPQSQIAWLKHLVRPGGQLVLAVSRPHWCTALVRLRWGHAAYQPDTVCRFLEEQGFEDIHVHPHAKGPPSRTSCGYLARRPVHGT